jgi:hypothetical protein
MMLGYSGELQQLLKNDGYTAWYFPVKTGTMSVCWELLAGFRQEQGCSRKNPGLAYGQAVYQRITGRWTHFKVRLTAPGREMLAHHKHLNVYPADEYTPLGGVGGDGSGPCVLLLSANLPTQPDNHAVCY